MAYLLRRVLQQLADHDPSLAAHVVMLWQTSLTKAEVTTDTVARLACTFKQQGIRIDTNPDDFHSLLLSGYPGAFRGWLATSAAFGFGFLGARVDAYFAHRVSHSVLYETRESTKWCTCGECIACVAPGYQPPAPCMAITPLPSSGGVQFGCSKVHCGHGCGTVRLFVREAAPDAPVVVAHKDTADGTTDEYRQPNLFFSATWAETIPVPGNSYASHVNQSADRWAEINRMCSHQLLLTMMLKMQACSEQRSQDDRLSLLSRRVTFLGKYHE
jgi:hypothetical protein